MKESAVRCIDKYLGVDSNGRYLDWNDSSMSFEHGNVHDFKVRKWLESGKGIFSRWFQRGPLPSGFIENSGPLLGLSAVAAKKFGVKWFQSKRAEGEELIQRRHSSVHGAVQAETSRFGELRLQLKEIVLRRRQAGLSTLPNVEYTKLRRPALEKMLKAYLQDEAEVAASQPSIMSVLQQQGLDADDAQAFTDREQARIEIASARTQILLRRRRRQVNTENVTPKISTILDTEDEQGREIDLDDNSTDSIEIVRQFMSNATLHENLDEEATAEISHMVDSLLQNNRESWEI